MSYCSFQTGEGMTLSTTQGNQLWTVPKARSSLVPLGWTWSFRIQDSQLFDAKKILLFND